LFAERKEPTERYEKAGKGSLQGGVGPTAQREE